MCMALIIGMMYEAKNTESLFPCARAYKEKAVAIARHSTWYKCIAVVGAKTRFVVLEHEEARRKNRLGEILKINIYRLLLDDGTVGWCMLPNCKTWKILQSEESK